MGSLFRTNLTSTALGLHFHPLLSWMSDNNFETSNLNPGFVDLSPLECVGFIFVFNHMMQFLIWKQFIIQWMCFLQWSHSHINFISYENMVYKKKISVLILHLDERMKKKNKTALICGWICVTYRLLTPNSQNDDSVTSLNMPTTYILLTHETSGTITRDY